MQFFTQDGQLSFIIAFYNILLDMKERHIVKEPEQFVDFSLFNRGEKLIRAVSRKSFDDTDFVEADRVKARPSWLDCAGHVDNVRYFEMAYDILSPEQRHHMDHLRRSEVYYHRELLEGETMVMKKKEEDGRTLIAGFKEDGTALYTMVLEFSA